MIIDMFPGQGSQYPGMGKELFDSYPTQVKLSSTILGYDVVNLCLNDESKQLNLTQYTQPLLYIVSCLSFLKKDKQPDLVIGHSLGIFSALFAAKVISFEQGLRIVQERARLMSREKNGAMLAVIGRQLDRLDDLLVSEGFPDVDIANDNTPTQRVLSGKKERLSELIPKLSSLNLSCIPLSVSGAFHSRYMMNVANHFFNFLSSQTFSSAKIPIISSTHGDIILSTHLLEELAYQLVQPVRWRQTVEQLGKQYQSLTFNEIAPGNVLTRLNKQIMQ